MVITLPPGLPAHAAALSDDEVHVWHARLDDLTGRLSELEVLLDAEERARAARYRMARDRLHFTLARGILRALLAAYCQVPPAVIAIACSAAGKPALAGPAGEQLRFNLSHSHGLAAYAFTRGRRVGIDVEYVREMIEAEGIVERYFAPDEIAAYQALPAEARLRGFFNGWVRKEAFVKALGEGLGFPLTEFAVSLAPGEPARLLHIPAEQGAAGDWTLCELAIDSAYGCALAVEGRKLRINCRQWPQDASST
jgi:4'-phosphopantetheinyl transferase